MILLLSGGLDSTVNAYEAVARKAPVKLALTFNYGQRAALKEIEFSARICRRLKLPHKVLELPWLGEITKTSLVNSKMDVPVAMDIDDIDQTKKTAEKVWVPNRNGVFLSVAAAFAESLGATAIVPGFNREEATTFPDNSLEYLKSFTHSLTFSTLSKVKVECFTTELDKTQIVARGRELGVNFEEIWPCYFAGEIRCGKCESCLRFERAIKK